MALLVVGFFGMFFLGALYLQGILGYNPLEVGLAFLPSCLVMGDLSLGYAERLIMGIGARAALIAGLALRGRRLLLFARRRSTAATSTTSCPVMLLLGVGAGCRFPALMTLAMSGATPQRLGPRVRLRQHDRAGRRRDRPGRARHARDPRTEGLLADGETAARAQLRLPPRLPDRRRADRRRDRGGPRRAALAEKKKPTKKGEKRRKTR